MVRAATGTLRYTRTIDAGSVRFHQRDSVCGTVVITVPTDDPVIVVT